MSDSSDSEEFYDAEEDTPIKGSKRSSISKSASLNESDVDKDKTSKVPECQSIEESTSGKPQNVLELSMPVEDDKTKVKNVVQDRRKFQELRRCLQTDEDEEGLPDPSGSIDQQTFSMGQPFKIIAHDTMSMQSMTSLGRIGRILSGVAESHPNMRDTGAIATTSNEPPMHSDDNILIDREQHNVQAVVGCEPDVIASTKANSLKQQRGGGAIVAVSAHTPHAPLPPPRRNKRKKLHSSQSLSAAEGDNLSISTVDTDEYVCVPDSCRPTATHTHSQPTFSNYLNTSQTMPLPSPASTIESLTREFQDSLEMSHSKYEMSSRDRGGDSWSTGQGSFRDRDGHGDSTHSKASQNIKTSDDERGSIRTHSESRTLSTTGTGNRRSMSAETRGRRRSAGDPTETNPRPLSDREILDQVTVLNLDTGERIPLSVAEHKLPQCINPLSLHIMRLTSEYIGRNNDDDNASIVEDIKPTWRSRLSIHLSTLNIRKKSTTSLKAAYSEITITKELNRETDDESESVCGVEDETKGPKRDVGDRQNTIKKKTDRLKRFFGSTVKKTVDAAKSLAQEVTHARHKEDVGEIVDEVRGEHNIKLKASNSHKGPYDFDGCVRHVQEMDEAHIGAVWCCKFSGCGRLLATAGQDKLLRIWVTRDAYHTFQDMRTKYNLECKCSPSPSSESLGRAPSPPLPAHPAPHPAAPFHPAPFAVYHGHTSDLLDVSWSKNYFVLSSSMDKTVRLWHISRNECLCCFQHIDFVTAIVFHPRDDRYFLSGSLDGKLRLWDIPDKKVAVWNEVDGKTKLITAANFCQNGKFAVVGTYDGRCIFYTTDQLKYHTQIDVRSTRGKNSTGRKISGIEPMPNDDKILVTSNDSRIRLYDLRDLNVSCKYKGYVNVSSQIKASFSHDGKYIVSGSENQCIYIWKTYHDYSKFTSVRRDRNDFWEGIKAHNAVVTCAVFAPNPDHMIRMITEREEQEKASKDIKEPDEPKGDGMVSSSQTGHVLVSADFNGCIKVFVHKAKPKHSSLPASALA